MACEGSDKAVATELSLCCASTDPCPMNRKTGMELCKALLMRIYILPSRFLLLLLVIGGSLPEAGAITSYAKSIPVIIVRCRKIPNPRDCLLAGLSSHHQPHVPIKLLLCGPLYTFTCLPITPSRRVLKVQNNKHPRIAKRQSISMMNGFYVIKCRVKHMFFNLIYLVLLPPSSIFGILLLSQPVSKFTYGLNGNIHCPCPSGSSPADDVICIPK